MPTGVRSRQSIEPPDAPARTGKRALFGWVLFDWATQPFYTLVVTFLFAPFFVNAVMADPADSQRHLFRADFARNRDQLLLAGHQRRREAHDQMLLRLGIGGDHGVDRRYHMPAVGGAGPIADGGGAVAQLGDDCLVLANRLLLRLMVGAVVRTVDRLIGVGNAREAGDDQRAECGGRDQDGIVLALHDLSPSLTLRVHAMGRAICAVTRPIGAFDPPDRPIQGR